jgi:hypothetical protein
VPRDSGDRDFYDADVPTDADPSPLRRVILAQAFEPGGAVVLLYTSVTLDGDGDRDGAGGAPDPAASTVEATAAALQLDPVPPDLFSPDAYLLQSALGERLLPGDA